MRKYVIVILILTSAIAGCSPEADSIDCAQLAGSGELNESCALRIGREYVAKQYPKLEWESFDVSFDEQDGTWLVIAEHASTTPGGYVSLFIDKHGAVKLARGGM
jgi:hypothetical protein